MEQSKAHYNTQENQPTPTSSNRSLLFILLLILTATGYFIYVHSKQQNQLLNQDYFRVLYEASKALNQNLYKLTLLLDQPNKLASEFPSYKTSEKEQEKTKQSKDLKSPICGHIENKCLTLGQQKFYLFQKHSANTTDSTTKQSTSQPATNNSSYMLLGSLKAQDIFPIPKQGFSQFLLATQNGLVLASSGEDKMISLMDLSSISAEIAKQGVGFDFTMDGKIKQAPAPSLPAHSHQVDMQLSSGMVRIFIYPFILEHPMFLHPDQRSSNDDSASKPIDRLYLIGLVSASKLDLHENNLLNPVWLSIAITVLIVFWSLLRLRLLPVNQYLGRDFLWACNISCFGLLIVILAALLAFQQKHLLQLENDQAATTFANNLKKELSKEISTVFEELAKFRPFYQNLIKADPKHNNNNNNPIEPTPYKKHLPCLLNETFNFEPYNNKDEKLTSGGLWPNYMHIEEIEAQAEKKFFFYKQWAKYNPNKDGWMKNYTNFKSIFAISPDGWINTPSIYLSENDESHIVYQVTHRDYFQRVSNQQGMKFQSTNHPTLKNHYIQRLLNIEDGSRGTTVSMPLCDTHPSCGNPSDHLSSYVLAADVVFHSMTIREPEKQDFTYLIVERSTGKVLFHSDNSRSMVENIYFTDDGDNELEIWLHSALDQTMLGDKTTHLNTHYHGEPGRFTLQKAPVDEWAILVFSPDDNLDALTLNYFVLCCALLTIALMLVYGVIRGCDYIPVKWFVEAKNWHLIPINLNFNLYLKCKLGIPINFDTKRIMHWLAILFGILLVNCGTFSQYLMADTADNSSVLLILLLPILLILALFLVLRNKKGLDEELRTEDKQLIELCKVSNQNLKRPRVYLTLMFSIPIIILSIQFLSIERYPYFSLLSHYKNIYCSNLNKEFSELNLLALTTFPNTIRSQQFTADELIETKLPKTENNADYICKDFSKSINPETYPKLNSLVLIHYLWRWNPFSKDYQDEGESQETTTWMGSINILKSWSKELLLYPLAIVLTLVFWHWLMRNVVWPRLYYSPKLLEHWEELRTARRLISNASNISVPLFMKIAPPQHFGIELNMLLRKHKAQSWTTKQELAFKALCQLSPTLSNWSEHSLDLPSVKIDMAEDTTLKKFRVTLWDFDVALAEPESRALLLTLLTELKSLVLDMHLTGLTLICGLHSWQKVRGKEPLHQGYIMPRQSEVLAWADCLMDFALELPNDFCKVLNGPLLKQEVLNMPELSAALHLSTQKKTLSDKGDKQQTLSYLQLIAEPLYWFKWESCSDAAKLALYNLSENRQLNPLNVQIIDELILEGLAKIEFEKVVIVTGSLSRFVAKAEPETRVSYLIREGEKGLWQSNKLLITMLMVILVGALIATSKQSMAILFASLFGAIVALSNLANSANFLRNYFK